MMESLTLRFTLPDGSTVDETVSLDFGDVPLDVMAQIVMDYEPTDVLGIAAAVLRSRLPDPDLVSIDLLRELLEEGAQGRGVTV